MADKNEKKQKIILAILGVVVVFVGISQIKKAFPADASMGDEGSIENMDLDTLQGKLYRAESLIKRADDIRRKAETQADRLGAIRENYLPPKDSPFAWVTDRINRSADSSGIKIEQVKMINQKSIVPKAPMAVKIKPTPPRFLPYQVHVKLYCSYGKLRRFIQEMEDSNPFVCINHLSITSLKHTPLSHSCEVIFEWPRELPSEEMNR